MPKSLAHSWEEVRDTYPNQFVVFEALSSHSLENKRIIDSLEVISTNIDGKQAMKEYLKLHRIDKKKELYVVHTDKQNLDITEKKWLGIRLA